MGDPFTEKLLIEATLEALKTGFIVGIQDMGAAGITCSTTETSAKAGTGMVFDCRKVPVREPGMTPYEIMLSESQERMLAIVQKGKEDEVAAVFKKWGLHAVVVGEVTVTGWCTFTTATNWWPRSRQNRSPMMLLPIIWKRRNRLTLRKFKTTTFHILKNPTTITRHCSGSWASPSIASKEWVYQQYDHMVQTNTAVLPGSDAGVLRIQRHGQGNRHHDGLQRPLLLSRPVRGRADSRGRSRQKPRVFGRKAGGSHRLPELRQSRKAAGILAVQAGGGGNGGGVRVLRRARSQRQRQLLQRDPGNGDLPHPGGRNAGRDRRRRKNAAPRSSRSRTTLSC